MAAPTRLAAASKRQALDGYGKLPLAFVPDQGQLDPRVRYSARQAGISMFFTRREPMLALTTDGKRAALALHFLGASPAAITTRRPRPETVNYLLRTDRQHRAYRCAYRMPSGRHY